MPGLDRTGPLGEGPATGWGMGLCRGVTSRVRAVGRGLGRGVGRGGAPRGGGRGRCFGGRGAGMGRWGGRFFGALSAPADEAEGLKAAISSAKSEIEAMESRLRELEKREE